MIARLFGLICVLRFADSALAQGNLTVVPRPRDESMTARDITVVK